MKLLRVLIASALSASFLFSIPEDAFAASHPSKTPEYRIVQDDVSDDATLYQLLHERYQDVSTARDAEVESDANSLSDRYVVRSSSKVEYLVNHGDFIEDIVVYPSRKKRGSLVKVRQLAYENGENYISSYYLK